LTPKIKNTSLKTNKKYKQDSPSFRNNTDGSSSEPLSEIIDNKDSCALLPAN
jgi:hypothetical protein